MSDNHMQMEKKALTDAEREALVKFLKVGLASGVTMAGLGALSQRLKSRKDRKDSFDLAKQRNVIVVPVDKDAFLSEVPTPEEQRKMVEGNAAPKALPLYDGDVDAAKKEILPAAGRKFNFFGSSKHAEYTTDSKPSSDDGDKQGESGNDKDDGSDNAHPRDELGRFVSGTDPVAVESEKTASDLIRNTFLTPAMLVGTGAASIFLATKIVDAINSIRKNKSKRQLDSARDEYVKMLESKDDNQTVKSAQPAFLDTPLVYLGGAFMIPAAITAVVVNRVMENRRNDKKKAELATNSIPDEPIVMYKTSGSEEIIIDPMTVLSSIMVKRAMFIDAELAGMEEGAEKKASYSDKEINNAVEDAVGMMNDPKNSEHLMEMVRAYQSGDNDGLQKAFSSMLMQRKTGLKGFFKPININLYRSPQFRSALASNSKFHDMLVKKFDTDKSFMALRDQMVGEELGKTFKPGSWLYQIVQWLSKATGFGRSMFNDKLKSGLASFAAPKAK